MRPARQESSPGQPSPHAYSANSAMLSLRSVGTLSAENHGAQSSLPLSHPSESSVMLVSSQGASEHDSFNGACNAKIVTPAPAVDGIPAIGGMSPAAGGHPVVATVVVGEGGKALLAHFLHTHSCLAIADVARGLHRGFVRLRLTPPRGSPRGTAGGVRCMAGSLTRNSGLVFIGRAGIPALQAVRMDPWEALGSLSQPLGDAGPVLALACHPSRPVVAASVTNGTIELWDYQGADGGGGRYSAGSAGGRSSGSGDGPGMMGGGDGYLNAVGLGSPPSSPSRSRGAAKGSKDERLPVMPRLEGRLSRIATLSVQGMPWRVLPADDIGSGWFKSVSFHPAREWLCACTERGLVGVWNLDGVVGVRSRMTGTRGAGPGVSGAGAGGGDGGSAGGGLAAGLQGYVRPFAARVVSADGDDTPGNDNSDIGNSGSGGRPSASTTVACVFLPSEPVVMVGLSRPCSSSGAAAISSVVAADDRLGLKPASEPGAFPTASTTTRLVLLSLLDGALPLLYSAVTPHAFEGLCVEARSGRIFASRSSCPSSFDDAASTITAAAAAATDKGGVAYKWAIMGDFFSRGTDSGGAATATATPSASVAASSSVSSGGCEEGIALFEGGVTEEGGGREGAVSVLALASGSFLDRGHSRVLSTTMEVPPTVFMKGVFGQGNQKQQQQQQSQPQQSLLPLPLQVYFLRSMAVLIQAGPGGGVDIPAVKAVLHAQGLERDKGLKDRSKPRRLASLPGHTDDLLRHTRDESSGYPSGHLMPYRLIPGPLLRLTASEEGGRGAKSGDAHEELRRFLVLYEIVASEGSARPPPASRDAALSEMSRTVCGLVTPAGYREAHGRYENEAQLSHLFPAADACFVPPSSDQGEPSALLVEGGGYLAAVYSIPDMKLLGRKALSLPVTRVLATPDCLGSQRGKVLYVVRSPRSPSGFLETMVYSDRGGLQCPEPLLPMKLKGEGHGEATAGWGGGRPYANAHVVLEENERVVDAKFQPLYTVAELSAWGYRQQQFQYLQADGNNNTNNASAAPTPMLAVLTTRRVLVLSAPRLTPVAEAWGHPRPRSGSPLSATGGLSVSPTSVAWVGSSVVCTLEDGRVVYLNPGDGMKRNTSLPLVEEPDTPERGAGAEVCSPWRPLCSVDRRLCAGGIGIAACLPDRLCLVARGGAGGGIAHLVTRPIFPLEPLVAGVLAASGSAPPLPSPPSLSSLSLPQIAAKNERGVDAATLDLLRRLVARYAPPRTRLPRGTNPGDGPGVGAGATCSAFRLLSRYGLHVLAAEVVGINRGGDQEEIGARSSDVFMRRRPWISPSERARCAAELGLPLSAMVEAIGDDPALADTCADPDAMNSALLPSVGSRLSRTALALAEQSRHLGLHDAAARLLDISGDDARLSRYLDSHLRPANAVNGNDHISNSNGGGGCVGLSYLSGADAPGASAVSAANAAAWLKALQSSGEAGRSVDSGRRGWGTEEATEAGTERGEGMEDWDAGVFFRRPTLLAGVPPLVPQGSSSSPMDGGGLKGGALEAAGGGPRWKMILEHAKPEEGRGLGMGMRDGGVWPPSCTLRPLALHCAEQWAGRVRPECLEVDNTSGGGRVRGSSLSAFSSGPRQPMFTPLATASTLSSASGPSAMVSATSTVAAAASGTSTGGSPSIDSTTPGFFLKLPSPAPSRASDTVATIAGGENSTVVGEVAETEAAEEGTDSASQAWVAVGGSWREEENVCGYWRFSEGAGGAGPLEEEKQVEVRDLSKYGCSAAVKGRGIWLEDTTSPVDPGEKGKVAEAVDVCFPEEDVPAGGEAGAAGIDADIGGGYGRGVFVRALRGSSIDVGLFHDDQRRSVATFEAWFNAGDKSPSPEQLEQGADAAGPRRFRQEFHVLVCRVSASGHEHVWSLVVENNGQLAFIPGPRSRRDLGPGFDKDVGGGEGGDRSSGARIAALKEAVYTKAGAFSWDRWTHVAMTMDTSRDESSAEVRLFLDGQRVGHGTCRFNKVPQSCLEETIMVLGPDLSGWKLTEARLWAMLRDEESIQDWKDNSLALAETKKARLVIRAVSRVQSFSSSPGTKKIGSSPGKKLAPPPLGRSSLPGKLAPPPGAAGAAAAGSSAGTSTAARRRLMAAGMSRASVGAGVAPVRSGGMLPPPPPSASVTRGGLAAPTSDPRRAGRGSRKPAPPTSRHSTPAGGLGTIPDRLPPPSSTTKMTSFSSVASAAADTVFSSSSSMGFPTFAAFTPASDGAPAAIPPEKEEVVSNTTAEMMRPFPVCAWGGEGQTSKGTTEKEEATSAGFAPHGASATEVEAAVAVATAPEAVVEAAMTPERPTAVPSWSAFGEDTDRRHSAGLPTPTNSEVSSIATPMTTPGNLLSWSAFGDDVTAGFGGSGQNADVAREETKVSGKQVFGSSTSSEPLESEAAEAEGVVREGVEKSDETVAVDAVATASAAAPKVTGSVGKNNLEVEEAGNGSVEERNSSPGPVPPPLPARPVIGAEPADGADGSHTAPAPAAAPQVTGSLGENNLRVEEEGNGSVEERISSAVPGPPPLPARPVIGAEPADGADGSHTAAPPPTVAAESTAVEVFEENTPGDEDTPAEETNETSTAEHDYQPADLEASTTDGGEPSRAAAAVAVAAGEVVSADDNGSAAERAGTEGRPDEEGGGKHGARDPKSSALPREASPTKTDLLRSVWKWHRISGRRGKGKRHEKREEVDSLEANTSTQTQPSAEALEAAAIAAAVLDATKPASAAAAPPVKDASSFGDLQSAPGSVVVPEVGDRQLTVHVEVGAVILAGPEAVLSASDAAAAHVRSPLLGSSGRFTGVPSTKGEMNNVAVTDLWNGGDTTRYPICCVSASVSPRTDEQIMALLSEGDMQVFSITHKIRRRCEEMQQSNVMLWKWLWDDVIVIVGKDEVIGWDTRENSAPKTLFKRERPHDPSAPAASRACAFDATDDGRWRLLTVAESERVCSSEGSDEDGNCSCETSLMIDIHDSMGSREMRSFRVLGAALLDLVRLHQSNPAAASGGPSEGDADSSEDRPWGEPLLAVVTVPEDGTRGVHTLRLLSLEGTFVGRDDRCVCSVMLETEKEESEEIHQTTGKRRRLLRYLRQSGVPAVPYRILLWRPVPGSNLLALVTLSGGLTVFQIEESAASLTTVFRDPTAFPGAVVDIKVDTKGELVVLSAGAGEEHCWVISRASVSAAMG